MSDQRLRRAIEARGIGAPEALAERLERYVDLLQKWNARINLTATRDRDEFIDQHVLDALAVVPHVPADARRLVDVGSGGGLPCVIIAAARPEVQVTALEPVHKKHAFLAAARRELALGNLQPLAQRDDEHRASAGFQPYDVASSRATFELPEWLARGRRLVRPGGRVLGMEGAQQFELPASARRVPYDLGDRTRAIVVLDVGDAAEPA